LGIKLRVPAEVAIAIEVAWVALVETLVENGFSAFSINPLRWIASGTDSP
jgi:hypothetical protein